MSVRRRWLFVAVVATTFCGCRAVGPRDLLSRPPAVQQPTPPAYSATELIERINKNAAAIDSLRADANIKVNFADRQKAALDGKLAFERPRDFKLDLSSVMGSEADIGSNMQTCWFWLRQNKDKEYYVCNYDEEGINSLSVSFQPDWIVEAMGLRAIPPEEAARMKVTPGSGIDRGTYSLVQRRKSVSGEEIVKQTVINESNGLIREHRLYTGDRKTLLARAIVSQYESFDVPTSGNPGSQGQVVLPSHFKLVWMQEQLELDISIQKAKINPTLDRDLFLEPNFRGYARVDLSKNSSIARGPQHRVEEMRESRPSPPPLNAQSRPLPESNEADSQGAIASPSRRVSLERDRDTVKATTTTTAPRLGGDRLVNQEDLVRSVVGEQLPTAPR